MPCLLYYCNVGVKILQAQLEEERRQRMELEARMRAEMEAEREAERAKMASMFEYIQNLGVAAGLPPPPPFLVTPPRPRPDVVSTPVSMQCSICR
jgi:hypothetical protein